MSVKLLRADGVHEGIEALEGQPPKSVLWVDLLQPTQEEIQAIERFFAIELPTLDEMREIESTSRLYVEDGCRFMTTPLLVQTSSDHPVASEVSFIQTASSLITIRHRDSQVFLNILRSVPRRANHTAAGIFLYILEAIVDRQADFLEKIGRESDTLSQQIFADESSSKRNVTRLRDAIRQLGRSGDLIARERECIIGLLRLVQFAMQESFEDNPASRWKLYPRAKPITKDLQSLSEYSASLSSKVSFMLDATLGLISIEQNSIVKIFSVAAVIFLPPTLIASIYGMNFKHMPELDWVYGYPMAIGLMVVAVSLLFVYCNRRGWL